MEYKEFGFGMFGWENDDIVIVGGMRAPGFHQADKMNCKFSAIDKIIAARDGANAAEVAKLTLTVNLGDEGKVDPSVDKFINLEIVKPLRRTGIGTRIVAAVLEASAGDLELCDIKKSAKGFWVKMGAENFVQRGSVLNAVLKKVPSAEMDFREDDLMQDSAPRP